jgi:anti-sigma regulatory factor (Ser/Thr protein kinase)
VDCDKFELTLHNQLSEIPLAHQALDDFASRHDLPSKCVTPLHVALEEHLANVISYGYEPGKSGTMCLRFTLESSDLRVEIDDDARAFNPIEAPEVDTSLPLESKPLGGLGLLMIRKSVDGLEYHRNGARNVLTMKKRLK